MDIVKFLIKNIERPIGDRLRGTPELKKLCKKYEKYSWESVEDNEKRQKIDLYNLKEE